MNVIPSAQISSTWPSSSDYLYAVQNCAECFKDPVLRRGEAQCDETWGLPIVASGNFAVVFCIRCSKKRRQINYAVRCFTRPVDKHQYRYEQLTEHLRIQSVSGLVNFEYLSEGILVGDDWYPIVKMRWVHGHTLDMAVAQAISQQKLKLLGKWAREWKNLMANLCQADIGHGDLQHGNILVDHPSQCLFLVDYDGMYIPSLKGIPPNEVGHPNYQHPRRLVEGYYADNVDSFPALVIYLTLLALREDPSLWKDFHHDDKLIFDRNDFQEPGKTPIWQRLLRIKNDQIRILTEKLIECCQKCPEELPSASEILEPTPLSSEPWNVTNARQINGSHVELPSNILINSPPNVPGTLPLTEGGTWIITQIGQESDGSTSEQEAGRSKYVTYPITFAKKPHSNSHQSANTVSNPNVSASSTIAPANPAMSAVSPSPTSAPTQPPLPSTQNVAQAPKTSHTPTSAPKQPASTSSQSVAQSSKTSHTLPISAPTQSASAPVATQQQGNEGLGCLGLFIAGIVVIICGILRWLGFL
ncbi:MAG: hypothetical protein RMI91_06570 [Gemmatales bacterium]|nr:hypothetical protein [Gemmatales bacterium]